MKEDKRPAAAPAPAGTSGSLPNRILGSLRDALAAASKDERSGEITLGEKPAPQAQPAPKPVAEAPKASVHPHPAAVRPPEIPTVAPQSTSAAEALREAKALAREPRHFEAGEPTTQAVRGALPATPKAAAAAPAAGEAGKTQMVRGKPKVQRSAFHQDPVVGWLVVVGGPGLGAFRPIYEGNNGIGRGKNQRIPMDFGDTTISSEEQAYIRYDSMDRSFLFVPNLSKTNIVAINDKKPTGAVKLELMDVITMGRTQLAFVPFCGEEFDWSELSDLKE
jgi:hypothetical protein